MNKLHLSAIPPNEGARRLVRWMFAERLSVEAAATRLSISAAMIERIVETGLIPCAAVITRVRMASGGAVRGFKNDARGWWFSANQGSRAAGVLPVAAARDGGAAACAPRRPEVAPPMGTDR